MSLARKNYLLYNCRLRNRVANSLAGSNSGADEFAISSMIESRSLSKEFGFEKALLIGRRTLGSSVGRRK